MLLCGWSPPAGAIALGDIAASGVVVVLYRLLPRPIGLASMLATATKLSATSLEALIACE